MVETKELSAAEALEILRAELRADNPGFLQRMEADAAAVIRTYKEHGEAGDCFLVFLACLLAVKIEAGEIGSDERVN